MFMRKKQSAYIGKTYRRNNFFDVRGRDFVAAFSLLV